METRKVKVTLTRYYSKQASIEIDVDSSIQGDELRDYLTEDPQLDPLFEDALGTVSLHTDDDVWEFQDGDFAGHL